MTNYFEKLSMAFMMPTEEEEKKLKLIAKEIEKIILEERKTGGTRANIHIDVWENRVYRYFLAKELLHKKFMVDPPNGNLDVYMKISWCNEDVLDIHRKRRITQIEEMITTNLFSEEFHAKKMREANDAMYRAHNQESDRTLPNDRSYRNMLGIPKTQESTVPFGTINLPSFSCGTSHPLFEYDTVKTAQSPTDVFSRASFGEKQTTNNSNIVFGNPQKEEEEPKRTSKRAKKN